MKYISKIIICIIIISIFSCTLNGCLPYSTPNDFEYTKWTCKDPNIFFYTNLYNGNDLGWLEIGGIKILIDINTTFENCIFFEINDTDRLLIEAGKKKQIVIGSYNLTSNKFTVYPESFVEKNEDGRFEDILNGRFKKLIFKRTDVSKEIDYERAELIAYYLLGSHCRYIIGDYNLNLTETEDKWVAVFEKAADIEGPETAEFHLDLISGKLIFNSLVDTADIE